jgi:hypothetical protein
VSVPSAGIASLVLTLFERGITAVVAFLSFISVLAFMGWVVTDGDRTGRLAGWLAELIAACRGDATLQKEHRPPD